MLSLGVVGAVVGHAEIDGKPIGTVLGYRDDSLQEQKLCEARTYAVFPALPPSKADLQRIWEGMNTTFECLRRRGYNPGQVQSFDAYSSDPQGNGWSGKYLALLSSPDKKTQADVEDCTSKSLHPAGQESG